jgi:lipopolysaccharide transport system ATP-binding protein
MNISIKVENVGKLYRLGEVGTGTLSHDLNRWWARLRGKEDPFAKVGEMNDRSTKGNSEYVWALRDIDFEVKQGEVMGIIGRNGAGKSTLLKILSKVTKPTTGTIKVKGRIASLLEVGTGFHPELTGRENIFLNGAILGMTKHEIRSKFDEIVDFSGVERYIDTPVKRYSSGMYVRLAFAVAAYLEPEILIVDEVLAVGDAEFQKKCLGRMKDVSVNDGRTVLFVSHNMGAVKQLCDSSILMVNGRLNAIGKSKEIIDQYLAIDQRPNTMEMVDDKQRSYSTGEAMITSLSVTGAEGNSSLLLGEAISIAINFTCNKPVTDLIADVKIVSKDGVEFSHSQSNFDNLDILDLPEGTHNLKLNIENNLQPGQYFLTIGLHHSDGATIDYLENILGFEVLRVGLDKFKDFSQSWVHGYVRPKTTWQLETI